MRVTREGPRRLRRPTETRTCWRATRKRRLESRPNVEGCGIRNVSAHRIGVVTDANHRAYERLHRSQIEEIQGALEPIYRRLCFLAH